MLVILILSSTTFNYDFKTYVKSAQGMEVKGFNTTSLSQPWDAHFRVHFTVDTTNKVTNVG